MSAFAHLAPEDDGSEVDTELFERLRGWRSEQAKKQQVPAYVVLHNSHLEEISTHKPRTIHELGAIKGMGLRRAARYGDELLALIHGEEVAVSGDTADAARGGHRRERLPDAPGGGGAAPQGGPGG